MRDTLQKGIEHELLFSVPETKTVLALVALPIVRSIEW